MKKRKGSLRKLALLAVIGVFTVFSAVWANGSLVPGGLPGAGIDWFVTSQNSVLAWGGNNELGLHVRGYAGDDDTDDTSVYAYDKSGGDEYGLDEGNLLVVRTDLDFATLQGVTVSNDLGDAFNFSSLLLWPDGGTFTGFSTPASSSVTDSWVFNSSHRGFHFLYDPNAGEPVPALLAKVVNGKSVEVVYNPFGEPVEASIPLLFEMSATGIQTAGGLENAIYSLPRRYTTSGLDVDLGTVFFNWSLIPATPGYNFELAITNWGKDSINLPIGEPDPGDPGRAFFLLDPELFNYENWIDGDPASHDLPPAFSFGKAELCDAYLEGNLLDTTVSIPGTFAGDADPSNWSASFMAKAYEVLAAFTGLDELRSAQESWDGLSLVKFTLPSADLDGKDPLYPNLVGTVSVSGISGYDLDRLDLLVGGGEGPMDGFTGDVRYMDLDVPYTPLVVPRAEGLVPVMPLRIRMDLSVNDLSEVPEAVREAILEIADDVVNDVPFDQAFLERFHLWVVLSDGQIVDVVKAAEDAGLDPTNVIRLMGTAITVPEQVRTTVESEPASALFCRGQLFAAVVDDGPAGVSFSNGAVVIHDGDDGDTAFTARVVLAPVSAREASDGGGGCSAAGFFPLGLFLLAPLSLLLGRKK